MKTSPVRKLIPFANMAIDRGMKVYYLNIGQPDIEILRGYFEAIKGYDKKVLGYAASQGTPELIDKKKCWG
ncbi:hypothetical protein [Clostridium gasigenes]|uniref:Aspartate aminotransferase n=1 Tax=Clostridium gasigenes TaxID=94869 RepID=A0A1H0TS29_9CLOT|nr:hypothetical protein [Clostridium gasigenes]SDP56743.1 aspartate aminotransferase [Clostridium gasigenes]